MGHRHCPALSDCRILRCVPTCTRSAQFRFAPHNDFPHSDWQRCHAAKTAANAVKQGNSLLQARSWQRLHADLRGRLRGALDGSLLTTLSTVAPIRPHAVTRD
jgi:hypothetical protein